MHLVDTSAIAEILLHDPDSNRTQALLESLDEQGLCLTFWTHIEVASAISRRVRQGLLSVGAADRTRQAYRDEFVGKHTVLPLTNQICIQAEAWVAQASLGLKTGDAMQLAAARCHRIKSIVTLDKPLRAVAATLGFNTPTP